jgi:hypothetical protein
MMIPFPTDKTPTFHGHPLRYATGGAVARVLSSGRGWADVLDAAVDTAGPGEPAGWHFESDGVWIELAGEMLDLDQGVLHGGYWTAYLPEEP